MEPYAGAPLHALASSAAPDLDLTSGAADGTARAAPDPPPVPPTASPRGEPPEDGIVSRTHRRWSAGAELAVFAVGGLVAMTLLAVFVLARLHTTGLEEGINDAKAVALAHTRFVVQPAVTDALVTGSPAAVAAFDRKIRPLLTQPGTARIKLWDGNGRIIYSDAPQLIGQRFALSDDDQETLDDGTVTAEEVDFSAPENWLERASEGTLLQVYTRVTTPSGHPLLYEVYFRLDDVAAPALGQGKALTPAFLLALITLEILQLPLAWALIRRSRRSQAERDALHRKAAEVSDNERRRIARDLHDGVVQSLAGVSYSLAAVGTRLEGHAPPDVTDDIASAAEVTRDSVRDLRSLIGEIYPADLEVRGLPAVLDSLLEPLREAGVRVQLEAPPTMSIKGDQAGVVYRAARECLRNVATHAGATSVSVRISETDSTTTLVVRDNGTGFDLASPGSPDRPHYGLRLMRELVADAGGDAVIDSAPGAGTTVVIEVPVR